MSLDPSPRVRFEDADVVRAYRHRPAYPPALLDFLIERAPGRARALDLGCGPGKLSIPLAQHFARVDAVDPSRAMLAALATGAPANLSWTCCDAEDFTLEGSYDLVTAGASVHWMDAKRLFPRLARHLAPGASLCIVEGDGPNEPPWQNAYVEFLQRWLPRVARAHDPQAYRAAMTRHEAWMDIDGRRSFAAPVLQPVEDFIELQHSRASFARHNLAEHEAEYRRELAELLAPFADAAGVLSYEVSTDLTWGRPRSELAP